VRIAHLGSAGSFSAEAALHLAAEAGLQAELRGAATFARVIELVQRGEAEYAVLPIASSSVGLVHGALAVLAGCGLVLAGEVAVPVRLALWVRDERVDAAALTRVASHPMALRACAGGLARILPGRALLEYADTATAARDLARGALDARTAVLASETAGRCHGLCLLARDLQDERDARTFFAVLRPPGAAGVEWG
jgi:chorismate mutase/prephenate dehydratase